jgi:Phosphotransferase enzyme family
MTSTEGRAVSVQDDVVIKVQRPEASRRERLRTMAGQEVGRQTGLFVVPRIVSFDDFRGEIVFERLQMTELRRALSDLGRSMELVERAAGALAAIHRHLKSGDGATRVYAGDIGIGPAKDPVPIHGDFGMRNVFYLRESNGLAVIDWANAHWMGIDADLGAPEIDIAVFLMSLFHRRPLGPWPVSRRRALARHFLTTYASASPHGLNIATLRAIVAASTPGFNQQVHRRKGILRALGYRYSMIDLDFFLRRLSPTG